jgi:hypothetical protein
MILIAILTLLMAVISSASVTMTFMYQSGKLLLRSKRVYGMIVAISFVSTIMLGNLTSQLFKGLASLT